MLKNIPHIIRITLLLLTGIIAVVTLQHYFNWKSPSSLLVILAVIATWQTTAVSKPVFRSAYAALACWFIYYSIPAYTICYFGLMFTAAFIIESGGKRIAPLVFLSAVLLAPVFDYFANIFTFPIRLWFSTIAGKSIAAILPAVTTEGNVIMLNNTEFSVDAACMGLNMMITSLLCGIILIAIFQKRLNRRLSLWWILGVLSVLLLLNILSNLFRMILLVMMAITPEKPAHDLVGLCSLCVYVLLPAYFIVRWVVGRYGKIQDTPPVAPPHSFAVLFLPVILFIIAGVVVINISRRQPVVSGVVGILPGTVSTELADQVIRQTSANLLLYIKPIPSFYFSDHQPMICWKGSGYEFSKVEEVTLGESTVYQAELKKPGSTLYTAWWYESKMKRSTSQFAWRWDALRNSSTYYLVNVTVSDPGTLKPRISQIMQAHLIH